MAKKNEVVVVEAVPVEPVPVVYDKDTPVTGEVGVVVFGNNAQLRNAVADTITRHLRHDIGMPHVERHEFHAPGRSHGVMQNEDSILDVLERANPQLMGTRVVVAVDNIGQSLISTEDARSLRRFGAESITRTGEYNTRVKLADLVARTEDKIADTISSAIRQAIEATESFTDAETQPAIVNELITAITDGTATTDGLNKVIEYAVPNVGIADPRLKERISFRDMVAPPKPKRVEINYVSGNNDAEVERELREVHPGISQESIDAFLGRGATRIDVHGEPTKVSAFQREMSDIIESMGGEALIIPGLKKPVPLIGDVFDNMIRTKVQATLACQKAADAEEACNAALEDMAESLDRLDDHETEHAAIVDQVAQRYLKNSGGATARELIEKHAEEVGLDPEVIALQTLKNIQRRGEAVKTGALTDLRKSYVDLIDEVVQENHGVEDTLEDLFELAKELPEGVSVRSSGAIISNNEDGPEAKLNSGNATYSRF